MAPSCPRCGGRLDAGGYCPSCAFAGVVDESVASAFPLELEEAAQRIAKRRGLADLEPVGRGGMGCVFRARQVPLDREVALKLFSAGSPERFEREARVLASLSHPNIVAIYDFGTEDDRPYFVMEFLDGPSLRTLIDMGGLTRRRALEILEQVGRALEYAHARGVIHRDIKPENVLTSVDGTVKVGDFGIARLVDQEGDAGGGSGTPAYMAPERRHIPGAADERSDVYSLGALAKEMLAGTGGTDARLDELILRAMEDDPEQRVQSVTDFLAALSRLKVPSDPLPVAVRRGRLVKSRFAWLLGIGSIASALVVFGMLLNERLSTAERAFESLIDAADSHDEYLAMQRVRNARSPTLDDLIRRESTSADVRRSIAALNIALTEAKTSVIAPRDRVRAIRARESLTRRYRGFGLDEPSQRVREYLKAADDGGAALAMELFSDLKESPGTGRIAWLNVLALARTADTETVRAMAEFLTHTPEARSARLVWMAFLARTGLPIADLSLAPVYRRHLPHLLDPDSGEARWDRAVELARDLSEASPIRTHLLENWIDNWAPAGAKGDPSVLLVDAWKTPWPIEEKDAARLESLIRDGRGAAPYSYRLAVLLRWNRTGRLTLPYFPFQATWAGDFMEKEEHIEHWLHQAIHGQEASLRILDASADLNWECVLITVFGLGGDPRVAATIRGRGPIQFAIKNDVPYLGQTARVKLSIGSLIPELLPTAAYSIAMNGSGTLKPFHWGGLELQGSQRQSFQGSGARGSSGGGLGGRGYPGEAIIATSGFWHMQVGGMWYGSFMAVLPDPPPGSDPQIRWRLGFAANMKRLAASSLNRLVPSDIDRLLEIAICVSVPEAAEGLRTLWNRRGEMLRDPEKTYLARLVEHCAAALMLIGDESPLDHPDLFAGMEPRTAYRIFLLSPSDRIRRAMESRPLPHLSGPDSVETLRLLEARGEHNSVPYLAAAKVVRNERFQLAGIVAPWVGGAVVLAFLGWLPRPRGQAAAIASSLVFTGLVLRMITLEVDGRLWIPFAGNFLLLAAAMLAGGWFYRTLASVMALTGLLHLMNPAWAAMGTAGAALLAAYLGILSLDNLTRALPRPMSRVERLAFLIQWWLLLVPVMVLCVAGPLLGPVKWTLPVPWYLAGAVFVFSVFWPLHAARRRLIRELTPSVY